jgi:hypothetical protein
LKTNTELDPTRFRSAAAAGLRVFPLKPREKTPATAWKQFQDRAPTDDELELWDASNFNVGIVCGAPSGIVVLDVDSPEAQELVDTLDLPATPSVRTSRGVHYYFQRPSFEVRNGVGLGGVKLDVRGDGGYVAAPDSIHPSGARYEWTVSPENVPFAPFPHQLLALREAKKNAPAGASMAVSEVSGAGAEGVERFLLEELFVAQGELDSASSGTRNDTLFKMAARMARHVAAAGLQWEPYAEALATTAASIGLENHEIPGTIESGWRAGSAQPTPWVQVAAEHVFLGFQERFYHVESGKDLKVSGFNGQFGRYYGGKGAFSHFLLTNGYIRTVHDITYDPLDDRQFIPRDGIVWLNTFKPSDVVAVEGDASAFIDFVSFLVPDEAERDHLLKMIAYTVRNPGRKVRHALLLRTRVQGIGKSILTEIWGALLGRRNVRKTSSKELNGDYQGYLPERLLVVCEELNLGMGLTAYNNLKDLITSDTATVNEKHLRHREWTTYATFAFLTNRPLPILVEETDRRFFYIDSPAEKRDEAYYREFAAWWPNNLGVIRSYLESIDLSKFNPFASPPMTASKLQLIEGSRSELAQDLAIAIEQREGCFDRDVVTLNQVVQQLGSGARGKSVAQIQKALKELGAVALGQQRVFGAGRASTWVIRNLDYWLFADAADRAEELQRSTGMFAMLDGTHIGVVHASQWQGDPELLFPPKPQHLVRILWNPDYFCAA